MLAMDASAPIRGGRQVVRSGKETEWQDYHPMRGARFKGEDLRSKNPDPLAYQFGPRELGAFEDSIGVFE